MTGETGGQALVAACRSAGVERLFCVPGESYLAVLDALYDARDAIDLISCRHESGAAMMAAASGHLSGAPGVAFVTRGPGATNASIAVHIAAQASLPMVLCVGQVTSAHLGREAFQEVDFDQFFRPLAKAVETVTQPRLVGAAMTRALRLAATGRPGPVVLTFPEDVLRGTCPQARIVDEPGTDDAPIEMPFAQLGDALQRAERPVAIVGGGVWPDPVCTEFQAFAAAHDIPVFSAFRRVDIFDNHHPCFSGYLGFGAPETAWDFVAAADCVLAVGTRFDEPTTNAYRLFPNGIPTIIHFHPDGRQLQRQFETAIAVRCDVAQATTALRQLPVPNPDASRKDWRTRLRAAYEAAIQPPHSAARVDLGRVMTSLNELLPADAIITTDAGNFSLWPLRYRRYQRPGRFIAPINGAMGYGVPAAIAASLRYPDRTVVGCVGDGGMLMTGMELATAMQYRARPIILVFNNGQYGTIATHQRRQYPGRAIGNALQNPDFAAFARSFGAFGARVTDALQFASAFEDARAAGTAAVVELMIDAEPDA